MENKTKTYYHYTLKDNVYGIIKDGLKPGDDGLIYLCESIDDCNKFIKANRQLLQLASGSSVLEIAYIPVELDPADVEESHDHNKDFIRCNAYTYDKTIPAEKIPFLDKIPLYTISFEVEISQEKRKEIKAREDKARKQLAKQGYSLKKSRAQTYTANNQGGYMIVQDGIIQAGERYDMTLEDVEKFIAE